VSFSKEDFEGFCSYVNVSCRCFDQNFVCHDRNFIPF
jgi:hypothetical protein